jgi:hypothetical protein
MRRCRVHVVWLAIACAGPPIAASAIARAEPDARADALFEQGKQLRAAGKIAEACSKFAASKELARGVGIILHLADCYERVGATASAWAEYREAAELARERGDARGDVAERRAAALEPKLASTMGVFATWLGAHPAASASASPSASAAPTDDSLATIAPAEAPAPSSSAPSSATAAASSPPTPPTSPILPRRDPRATRRWLTLGLVGVGAAGVGLGATFLAIKNQSMNADAPNGDDRASKASAIAFGIGGAALVSAVVLYLTAPTSNDTALVVAPAPMVGGAGAVVQSRF